MKCFTIDFKKIELVGIKVRFSWIQDLSSRDKRQMSVSLPMGQGQNSATGVLATPARPRTATSHESLARRVDHSRCCVQSQKTAVALNSSCPEPVVEQEIEIFVPLPLIELPDPEGFYASLVLRKIRAEFPPSWKTGVGSSCKWNTVDRAAAAQTSSEVAHCGTSGEPIEMLLADMVRRSVQTPVLEGRSS
jgi:hypothetical protein